MSTEKLTELHTLIIDDLLAKIRSGDAKSSDLEVARKLLKDNNIDALPVDNSPLRSLMDELPFNDEKEKVSAK
tara:strand:+ start:90 stop:308 length:219 start_codon:yes stop_codon:yes gene_type:complete